MANPGLKIDRARYILTLDAERRIIRDGSIVIEGQRITHVDKAPVLAAVKVDRVIDASDKVVVEAYKQHFVDEGPLMQKVQEIGENLMARTGISFPHRWPMI